jgi:hypothetical protein
MSNLPIDEVQAGSALEGRSTLHPTLYLLLNLHCLLGGMAAESVGVRDAALACGFFWG